ncbi:3,4-dihydroxy-2-butanone-4-phosphate synthase [Sphingomonas sp. G-3-2-10]|uniref:3,4-dihydroxy-2-butanone-4-phosphate synthase n=1 Tax=Sphingomonas sp. G-3-2-10 TaxID=2728838 RepID=UPI00146EAB46|nr:3,4-dihydroxy-2-butanone-4-phosphate synthase [Sphingomonas sp. G-3-2-10]NML08440.1 3,4-dihydroxy-2-butanone-4-phosphate synthase [Sphingomonas sp. G-3-2-10]
MAPQWQPSITPIADIIEGARNGRPFILVDAESRENEGDVIVPAQMATPEVLNFMAKYCRGLICLAISGERARQLRLSPMAVENGTQHGTAFTVSIEAREGVTTGISVHDRARTIAVAIDSGHGADDIVTPGHVFPLVARDGGVLVRAGHTEAAVDIARLAGLNPSGVICEIMNEDGSMARLPDLIGFAEKHQLAIGTIADLIAYRRQTERNVARVSEMPFESVHGSFNAIVYRNLIDESEHVALVKDEIGASDDVMVRMHRLDIGTDVLGLSNGRDSHLVTALRWIATHEGPGVAVLLQNSEKGWLSRQLSGDAHTCIDQATRDYGIGAQILLDLGVRRMVPLTSAKPNLAALAGYDLEIVGWRQFQDLEHLRP